MMISEDDGQKNGTEFSGGELVRLRKDLEECTRLAEDRLSRLKYLQSDFDNFRKWAEKEKAGIVTHANENLLRDLLVILDDFELALPSLGTEKNREGMQMVFRKLTKILRDYGLEPIECVGKKFDPNLHEVLCSEPSGKEPGTVLEDLMKGYRLRKKVIRPSKVKIAEHAQAIEK
ncbi:MAG TPA: nucleotide exchange factor GrpE [Methanoregulaceae archaeon]|nr:nucleotide exchange factor GrpE [Methanoregulaceae archaeon]HPD75008.1 nucleotide exchange factor GrpE [Methanoregulaceae archaeon]HRY75255.1 nucleotide exchange factor GrpE [Methanoregulaceae archaeon]